MLKYAAYLGIVGLARILPRNVQYWIAHRLADLHYLLDAPARRSVIANLRQILGPGASEAQLRRQARWVFRSFGMYLCEFFGAEGFGNEFFERNVTVVGQENLDLALKGGRGMVFVSGHYSNWELGAFVVGRLGYPIVALTQTHAEPRVNELFVGQRAKHGVTVVHTHSGARAVLRALRENRPVAILGDRLTGGPAVRVNLFGRPTWFPQGPWRISVDTGAPLLPTFVYRRFNRDYTLHIGAPIDPPAEGTKAERIAALAQAFADALETRVKADPCQWAVFYPVWKDGGAAAPSASLLPTASARAGRGASETVTGDRTA
ncbi:MAG: lysophospholipid acyltransferase family protein [Planctomycetota bacterium]|nr:lysophospholipid acyltransferase family protein [Planctomycetota bacterium]